MVNRASIEVVLKTLLCLYVCCFSFTSWGQSTLLDQNPFSLKFQKISLKEAPLNLYFPVGYDSVAQETAHELESKWASSGSGFSKNARRFPVLLQNQGLVSNGFVSLWAPRAEFLTTPSQDAALLGTNDWLPLLVSHEMRHVHQNNAAKEGLARWVHGLFGAYGQAVYSNLMIPNWLWEGDAIETESRMNAMGRSQIPQFKMPLMAYLKTYGVPSYAKMMGKSYQQLVPNHYVFGQYLSQQMTKDFGESFIPSLWQSALNHPTLFGFSRQFKKRTGKSIDQYSHDAFAKIGVQDSVPLQKKQGFTQYLYPNILADGRIIALKTGFSNIKQLVEIKDGHERRLTYFGPLIDASMLSASDDYVVWSELVFHPRWGQKQQSRLIFYSLRTGKKSFWGANEKWISPSISTDSKYVSFIHLKENGQSSLKVYNLAQRKVISIISAKSGEQFLQPRLNSDGTLVYIVKYAGNKSVCIWDFIQQREIFRKDFGQCNIAHPVFVGNWIYMNYPAGDVDQIARISRADERFEVMTQERFGAYFGHPTADSLIYSAYTAAGHQLVSVGLNPSPIDLTIQSFQVKKDTLKLPFPIQSVSKWNLLNPFSWGPVLSSSGTQLEYSVISRDVFNSLQVAAGTRYGMNEKSWNQFARLSYQALYPIIDVNYQISDRKTQLYIDNKKPLDSLRVDQWRQQTWDIGIRIPFNLTHSAYQEFLQVGSNLGLLQVSGYDLAQRYYSEPFNGNYSFLKHQIYYSKLLSKSLWDVQSRKGFVLQANWNGIPFKQKLHNELWNLQAQLYLPGLLKHDGILLRYAYQQESEGNYRFGSSVFFPRGYLYTSFNQLTTMGIDYRFPIKNTDINIGRLVYVSRIKGNVFGDLGIGKDNLEGTTQSFHAFGVDLLAQFHALRFSQGFELGVRALYISESKTWAIVPLVIDIGF
ncbi:MAG: hypothetical protein RL567_1596 [Bacteroidota bacterium]